MDAIAVNSLQPKLSLRFNFDRPTDVGLGIEVDGFGSVLVLHFTGRKINGDLKLVDEPSEDPVPDSLPDCFLLHDSGLSNTF